MTLLLSVAGFVLLVLGADWLVKGSSTIATHFRISPVIIGLTVVAMATGSPELAVSVHSAVFGSPDISVGNVVGSNIMNVLFVLGLAAVISPLLVSRRIFRLDVPIMIGASLMLLGFTCFDRTISRLEGLIFLVSQAAYMVFIIRQARRERRASAPPTEIPVIRTGAHPLLKSSVLVLTGIAGLVLGAKLLVDGAVVIARTLNIPELVIGLTIVAIGTSLPEIAASITAGIKGEKDIAVGNVVGSNIFNILCVLGFSALVAPNGLPVAFEAVKVDIPVMTAAAAACFPLFFARQTIGRWEGLLFLAYYACYAIFLVASSLSPSFSGGEVILLGIVLPLTVLAVLLTARAWRINRA